MNHSTMFSMCPQNVVIVSTPASFFLNANLDIYISCLVCRKKYCDHVKIKFESNALECMCMMTMLRLRAALDISGLTCKSLLIVPLTCI
jgi:hypothetical protein